RQNSGHAELLSVSKEPSAGLRHGAIVDLPEAAQAIRRALAPAVKISKAALKNIYISIGTTQAKMQSSRGIVAVSSADTQIYPADVDRAVRASQAVNLPQNRMIVHTLTKEFVVDGMGDISDPLGLSGSRLEVQSLIIDAFSPHVKGLIHAVELAGGEVDGLVFAPLVAARGALSRKQKELGTAIVDIGFGTTGLAVYEENKLVLATKFPVGADHVSKDIAVGLKIPVDAAENIKLHYGCALAKEVGAKDSIELKKFISEAKGSVSLRFIAEIIESRLEEIFDFVNGELRIAGKYGSLPGGIVLVGGGAKLPGLADLVKQEVKLSSQIGCSIADEWQNDGGAFKESLEDPELVNAFGLALWGIYGEKSAHAESLSSGFSGMHGIKKFIRYFMP
ncbi:MAG: cell division protein FtsA, partial [Patescibacteria group bacterium]|nr:cell division protein FtsA [Patescibacteria group bacterium]